MNRIVMSLSLMLAAAAPAAAFAHTDLSIGLGVAAPVYAPPPVVYEQPAPVYYNPPPPAVVYEQVPPVYTTGPHVVYRGYYDHRYERPPGVGVRF